MSTEYAQLAVQCYSNFFIQSSLNIPENIIWLYYFISAGFSVDFSECTCTSIRFMSNLITNRSCHFNFTTIKCHQNFYLTLTTFSFNLSPFIEFIRVFFLCKMLCITRCSKMDWQFLKWDYEKSVTDIKIIPSEYKCVKSIICFSLLLFVAYNLTNRWRCNTMLLHLRNRCNFQNQFPVKTPQFF